MSSRPIDLNALVQQDLSSFIEKSFQALAPGETYHHNWHIDCLAWHLQQCLDGNIKRLIITLPPRHLKSICASVAFPAWALAQDPTRKLICVSYSNELTRKLALDFRSIMDSNWYRKLFPKTRAHRRKDTELEFMTSKRGFRLGTSLGGSLTGRGGNFIIIDDPIKPAEAMSEAERERVKQWYDNTLYSRLDNKREDVIILVMQRVHVDDLVGHVLEKEDWVQVNIPAIAEQEETYQIGDDEFYTRPAGEILQESREDAAALEAIKATLGSYNFSAQYQQCPVPPGGNMVQWEWFKTYKKCPAWSDFDQIVQSWDTASKAEELHDYSVCTTWGVLGSDYYLLDVVRERLEYPDLRRRVISEARRCVADTVLIEDAGSGTLLVQDLRMAASRQRNIPRPIAIRPRGDKVTRMAAQTAKIEAGQVLIPESAPWLHDFQLEVLAFPNGRHDDQVDSMAQFLRWIARRQYRDGPRERPDPVRPLGRPRSPGRRRSGRRPISGLYYWSGFLP